MQTVSLNFSYFNKKKPFDISMLRRTKAGFRFALWLKCCISFLPFKREM